MTPAEHYTEAERLLGAAANATDASRPELLDAARIHATLATVDTSTWHMNDVPKRTARP